MCVTHIVGNCTYWLQAVKITTAAMQVYTVPLLNYFDYVHVFLLDSSVDSIEYCITESYTLKVKGSGTEWLQFRLTVDPHI